MQSISGGPRVAPHGQLYSHALHHCVSNFDGTSSPADQYLQALISVAKAATPEAEVKGESDVSAAPASAVGSGVRKRLNKEDRLREKAAADAEAVKGRRLRCIIVTNPACNSMWRADDTRWQT